MVLSPFSHLEDRRPRLRSDFTFKILTNQRPLRFDNTKQHRIPIPPSKHGALNFSGDAQQRSQRSFNNRLPR